MGHYQIRVHRNGSLYRIFGLCQLAEHLDTLSLSIGSFSLFEFLLSVGSFGEIVCFQCFVVLADFLDDVLTVITDDFLDISHFHYLTLNDFLQA